MKKWYDEEYEFTVEVTGFLHGDKTEHYCRNGEEIGDKYTCTYGCPVNKDGYGICFIRSWKLSGAAGIWKTLVVMAGIQKLLYVRTGVSSSNSRPNL